MLNILLIYPSQNTQNSFVCFSIYNFTWRQAVGFLLAEHQVITCLFTVVMLFNSSIYIDTFFLT